MHQHRLPLSSDETPIALRDDGWIRYVGAFLSPPDADRQFAALRHGIAWQQFHNHLWTFPRLTAFVADVGVDYRYSGVRHVGTGWPELLLDLKHAVEQASAAAFNGALLNLYRDGNDSMGRHADAERALGRNPLVASVSLGATRRFVLRHRASGEKRVLDLANGSLLIMGGALQHHWVHELPKSTQPVGERINLTFRRFVT